jgi:hypothetical protein
MVVGLCYEFKYFIVIIHILIILLEYKLQLLIRGGSFLTQIFYAVTLKLVFFVYFISRYRPNVDFIPDCFKIQTVSLCYITIPMWQLSSVPEQRLKHPLFTQIHDYLCNPLGEQVICITFYV